MIKTIKNKIKRLFKKNPVKQFIMDNSSRHKFLYRAEKRWAEYNIGCVDVPSSVKYTIRVFTQDYNVYVVTKKVEYFFFFIPITLGTNCFRVAKECENIVYDNLNNESKMVELIEKYRAEIGQNKGKYGIWWEGYFDVLVVDDKNHVERFKDAACRDLKK